jgi:uncharacterized protein YkwD
VGCGAETREEGPSVANPLDSLESTLVYELNGYRAEAGAPALAVCRSLNVSASAHADDMRDLGYQSDVAKDGSTARERACEAGYAPACSTAAMAELIASGSDDPVHTLGQWKLDEPSNVVAIDAKYKVIGVGLSQGAEEPVWTLDLGSEEHASCP